LAQVQPEAGRWDWRHADEPLEYLLSLGISPQVDLVHYGLPAWLEGAYLNPDYPEYVAEFAAPCKPVSWTDPLVHAAERAAHHCLVLRPARLVATPPKKLAWFC
jgi:hypothetical protein